LVGGARFELRAMAGRMSGACLLVEGELRADKFRRREVGGVATKALERDRENARRGIGRGRRELLGSMIALREEPSLEPERGFGVLIGSVSVAVSSESESESEELSDSEG